MIIIKLLKILQFHRENYLILSMPSIDETEAKQLARKLSSLKAIQRIKENRGNHDRLKAFFKKLLRLAESKRHSNTLISRHKQLMTIVGEATCNDVISTVQEIKEIRFKSGLWIKFSEEFCRTHQDRSKNGKLEEERVSAAKTIPRPMFDVYFRIRLVEAMQLVDSKPVVSLEVIRGIDWEDLLQDAKEKLAAYRKFETAFKSVDEELSTKCGFCSSFSSKGNISG